RGGAAAGAGRLGRAGAGAAAWSGHDPADRRRRAERPRGGGQSGGAGAGGRRSGGRRHGARQADRRLGRGGAALAALGATTARRGDRAAPDREPVDRAARRSGRRPRRRRPRPLMRAILALLLIAAAVAVAT